MPFRVFVGASEESAMVGRVGGSLVRGVVLIGAYAILAQAAHGNDWPQWLGSERDGIWREPGILERFPKGGPPVRWRVPIGPGYTGPAVAQGRVYVMDRQRATDADGKPVPAKGGVIPGTERVLCLDARDG